MAKIRNITVCGSEHMFIKLREMGYSCTYAKTDENAIIHDVLDHHSCAVIADMNTLSHESLSAALDVLTEIFGKENTPLCIAVSGISKKLRRHPSVKCFAMLPDSEIINAIFRTYANIHETNNNTFSDSKTYITSTGDLERQITEIMQKMGIPANVKGYRYLRNAIMLATRDVSILDSVTKILYPTVAEDNNTTPTRVERAIRHAITTAWDRGCGDVDFIEKRLHFHMNYAGQKPTNSELIAMISDCMRLSACR